VVTIILSKAIHMKLLEAGLAAEIVEEITRRTPRFVSWQQEVWRNWPKRAFLEPQVQGPIIYIMFHSG